jgi:hypothetical protein
MVLNILITKNLNLDLSLWRGDGELYSMEQDVISETYDDYLKKYPSSVRKVLKEKPDLNKKDLCFYVSKHNQERAHNLLFKILKERMRWWWD